ncbi:putative sulfate/molybdate transporter [Thermodesulfobacteriota bacterium]
MVGGIRFNRRELSGSLGDLGTLLPIAIGLILINGLNPVGLFLSIGISYIFTGLFFKVTVPIQPMKVIGAYAIATGISGQHILASGVLMGIILLVIGVTGAITVIGKYIPKAVVRGVQLTTGIILVAQGVRFIIGSSKFQILRNAAEPYLFVQNLGPIPIGIIIGVIAGLLTLALLENKRFPAGLLVVLGGMIFGAILGTHEGLNEIRLGVHLPEILPLGMPDTDDFIFAMVVLVLPQIPMTLGNAVISYVDLSKEYFGELSKRVTYSSSCTSMALINFFSFIFGGMPLCHGAGGLAAHYRFGARTCGSNLIIGIALTLLAFFIGGDFISVFYLIPMSVLGVLLIFAGSQLALTIIDIRERKGLFIALTMMGITLASNLAAGFIAGIIVAYILKSERFSV